MDETLIKPALKLIPEGKKPEEEIVKKRTINAKHFYMGSGRYKCLSTLGAVHYQDPTDKMKWKDIDLTIEPDMTVHKAPYDIEIFTDRVGYSYTSKKGGKIDVELESVAGQPVDNFTVRQEGNVVWWKNVANGVDLKVILRPLKVEIFKRISNALAPRQFRWKIKEDIGAKANFIRKTAGGDEKKQALEIVNQVVGEKIIGNRKEFFFNEEWTGRVGEKINKFSRQKKWTGNVVYPVVIDATTQELIVANIDDGDEQLAYAGWFSITSLAPPQWLAGWSDSFDYQFHGGIRFRTLGIPQGATINSAILKLKVSSLVSTPQIKIYADDVDDAALWSNGNLPSGITKTTASKAWSPTAIGVNSVSITSVLQEIINRTGWVSNNDIRFGIFNQVVVGVSKIVYVSDYICSQANAAILDVDYTATKLQDLIPAGSGMIPFPR